VTGPFSDPAGADLTSSGSHRGDPIWRGVQDCQAFSVQIGRQLNAAVQTGEPA
jgi:hypothetical protein